MEIKQVEKKLVGDRIRTGEATTRLTPLSDFIVPLSKIYWINPALWYAKKPTKRGTIIKN